MSRTTTPHPSGHSTKASIEPVKEWLRSMARKGEYPENSARFRITALDTLVTVLAPDEPADLRYLLDHIDDIARRWATKTHANPETAVDYRGRAKTALEEYLRYQDNPLDFKAKRRDRDANGKASKPMQRAKSEPRSTPAQKTLSEPPPSVEGSDKGKPNEPLRTFPLAGDRTFLYQLPAGELKVKDAIKIALHLVTFAVDFDPMSRQAEPIYALARTSNEE
jgi:hypothetical protein